MITAFVGCIGSGKDYGKQKLVSAGAVGLDFKDALLAMASDLVGYDVTERYDYFKENIVGTTKSYETDHMRMVRTPPHVITGQVIAQYPEVMTGRRLLQRLGTEVMRKRDLDFWAKQWAVAADNQLASGRDIACADCRFDNEVRQVIATGKKWNTPTRFIFCDYRSSRYDCKATHASEAMAQMLLARGHKDGQILTIEEIVCG